MMHADIAQIIKAGWNSGKSANDAAAEILREFDVPAALAATPAVGGEVTEDQIEAAILKFARDQGREINLTYDKGSYEVTTSTWLAKEFARAMLVLAAPPATPLRGREWQHMSTAPKDAEIIGQDSDGRIFNLRWEPDDSGENWYDVHGDQLAYPIRWMPIPPRTKT